MFKHFTIKKKLGIGFAIIIAIFIIVSGLTITNTTKLITANKEDKDSWEVISILDGLEEMQMGLGTQLEQNADQSPIDLIEDLKKDYQDDIATIKTKTSDNTKQQTLIKSAEEYGNNLFTKIDQAIEENATATNEILIQKINEVIRPDMKEGGEIDRGGEDQYREQLESVKKIEETQIDNRDKETAEITKITFISLISGTIIGAILSIITYLIINRSVVVNIRKTSDMLKDIAEGEGDLTKRLDVHSKDEIGEMATHFNSFLDKISKLIGEVVENANILNQSTQDVLASIEESNSQMLEVASSVETVNSNIQNSASVSEEALASIQEISGQAQMIFSEAQHANDNGDKVLNAAQEGENSVNEAVMAISTVKDSSSEVMSVIGDLKRASNEIGKIVLLITQITEQTSLLSLNASIEAARAGEAGKGFAVVANEVKKLSEESKQSANQITSIVDEIQAKMQETDQIISKEQNYIMSSSDKVLRTSQEFHSILTHIQGISQTINAMTNAAKQQSNITSEMTTAVSTLSEGLQENAATSYQISTAVQNQAEIYKEIENNMENIKAISDRLKGQTERFKI